MARRSNCLFFVVALFASRGGYIAIRRSRHKGHLPHFLWSPDLKRWLHYSPRKVGGFWQPLLFDGVIRRGDRPPV